MSGPTNVYRLVDPITQAPLSCDFCAPNDQAAVQVGHIIGSALQRPVSLQKPTPSIPMWSLAGVYSLLAPVGIAVAGVGLTSVPSGVAVV